MISAQHYVEIVFSILTALKTKIYIGIPGAALAAGVTALIPGIDTTLLTALLVLITIDMVTGVCASIKENVPVQSRLLIKSAFKLFVYLLLAMAAAWTDVTLLHRELLLQSMIGFLAATELLSVLENTSRMGYGVPRKVMKTLRHYRDAA